MTTTPSVADVLGGPATGEPGVFPDQIKLAHNTDVRHHLNHMPDPVIRPGGWPFASWFPTGAPQAADRHDFERFRAVADGDGRNRPRRARPAAGSVVDDDQHERRVAARAERRQHRGAVRVDHRHAMARGASVRCGRSRSCASTRRSSELEPGKSVSASSKVFWSTAGFAFERPGRYRVDVAVTWSAQGVLVGVQGGIDVFVDYPTQRADNHSANLVLHPEVGKWVALGGGAYHLGEACRRLQALGQSGPPAATRAALLAAGDGAAAPHVLDGFADVMPDRAKLARLRPELTADAGTRAAAGPARAAAPGRGKRGAKAKRRRGRKG